MKRYTACLVLDESVPERIYSYTATSTDGLNLEKKIKTVMEEAIADHEKVEILNDEDILNWANKINREFDRRITDTLGNLVYDIINDIVDTKMIDTDMITAPEIINCVPSIDAGELEDLLQENKFVFVCKWKKRAAWEFGTIWSVSTSDSDYFVFVNILPEV